MRFLLIDRILKLDVGGSIVSQKTWLANEEFFKDHFPGFPVVPGVLLTESIAQTLGLLLEDSHQKKYPDQESVFAILSIIHKTKFKGFVKPGDLTRITGEIISLEEHSGVGRGKVWVQNELRAESELQFRLFPKSMAGVAIDELTSHRDAYRREIFRDLNV